MPRKQLRPAIKLRKKFAPLIELCRTLILTAPPQTSGTGGGDKTITVIIKWPTKIVKERPVADLPRGFPAGLIVERLDGAMLIKHDVQKMLRWFKEKHYITYDAQTLFAGRLPAMMLLAKAELKLDRLLESVDVELQHEDKKAKK